MLLKIAFDLQSACGKNVVMRFAVGFEAAAYRNVIIRIIHNKVGTAPEKIGNPAFVISKIVANYVVPVDDQTAAVDSNGIVALYEVSVNSERVAVKINFFLKIHVAVYYHVIIKGDRVKALIRKLGTAQRWPSIACQRFPCTKNRQ